MLELTLEYIFIVRSRIAANHARMLSARAFITVPFVRRALIREIETSKMVAP